MRRRRALSLLVVAALDAACAAPAPPGVEVDPMDAVELPLSFREGLPEVVVRVGDVDVTLMLDTGAFAAIALSPRVLARVAVVAYTGRTRRFRNAVGETLAAREFVLGAVALGPLRVERVPGVEHVFAPAFAPPNRDGYVGLGLCLRHRVLVDYPARRAVLLSGPEHAIERGTAWRARAPVDVGGDGIVLAATVDGRPLRLVVDTGSTHSLLRPDADRGGRRPAARRLVIGGLALEDFAFVEADAGPPGVDGILGRNLFADRRVLLDLPGRRLALG